MRMGFFLVATIFKLLFLVIVKRMNIFLAYFITTIYEWGRVIEFKKWKTLLIFRHIKN